jgi:phage terminase small subunit
MTEVDQVEGIDHEGEDDAALQSAYDQLKPWEQIFVDKIVSGSRGTEAARAASYGRMRPDTAAWRLQQRPLIRQAIEERRAQAAADAGIEAHRVLVELGKLAFSNMQDFIAVQDDGSAVVDLKNLTRDQSAAIQEITVEEYIEGGGEDARDVKRTKFKLADKRGALQDLAKYLKLFTEKHEFSGPDGRPLMPAGRTVIVIGGPPEPGEPVHVGDGGTPA